MQKTLLFIFIALIITTPFLYRFIRLGSFSWFVKKNQLAQYGNYYWAEQLRFAQILVGYSYFLIHGSMIWGYANIILFALTSFIISIGMEVIGTKTGLVFGGKYKFDLNKSPGPSFLGIPLVIPLAWSGLIYMSLNFSSYLFIEMVNYGQSPNMIGMTLWSYFLGGPFLLFLPSLLLVVIDLVLDPIAVDERRWEWQNPGSYYGVPILNFIGWFITAYLILWIFSMIQYQNISDKHIGYLFKYSPGFFFCLLPAIASRPCFERGLKIPGTIGLVFSFGLLLTILIQ